MNQSQLNDLYEKLVADSVPPPQTEEERNIEASMLNPGREPVDGEAVIEALKRGKVLTVWNHPHDGKLRIFRPACYRIGKSQPAKGKEGGVNKRAKIRLFFLTVWAVQLPFHIRNDWPVWAAISVVGIVLNTVCLIFALTSHPKQDPS